MKVTVKIYENSNEILSRIFEEGVYRLGRSEFSDLVLPGENISRSHLELRVTDASVYMTNMSSAGKVKLNGKPRETAELADGDEIQIGSYNIVVFHGDRSSEAEPVLTPQEGEIASNDGLLEQPLVDAQNVAQPEGDLASPLQDGAPVEAAPEALAEPDRGTSSLLRAETQVELKPVVAKLIFQEGPRAGEELFLEAYEVALGRSKKADIFLDDEKLSRIHAKIARVGMGYRLIDLNSRNGTYVNGMRILEHPLASFDEIQIGSSKIKFIILDLIANDIARGRVPAAVGGEQTKSIQLATVDGRDLADIHPGPSQLANGENRWAPSETKSAGKTKYYVIGVLLLLVAVYFLPSEKHLATEKPPQKTEAAADKLPPSIPQEFTELSPTIQRRIEGWYNSAEKAAQAKNYKEGLEYLGEIHKMLPFYKQSLDMQTQLNKLMKEQEIEEAQQKAQHDEKEDLALYIEEGKEYLKEGDYDRAAEAFNAAIVIDPSNKTSALGLKAAEAKVHSIEEIPAEKNPEQEKREAVNDLLKKALEAFSNKSYQLAIDTAEKVRTIELKNDTQYLNEAKQIIDRSRMMQKEEFEPFLVQAKEKYAEGDYNASRDLCEEMLKRDSAYDEAKECAMKAKKQLNRLAKEAYTHGYILESMNRIEEAKQYWNRAKNYVRSGDDYYDKVMKKLDQYQ